MIPRNSQLLLIVLVLTAFIQAPSGIAAEQADNPKPRVEKNFFNGKDLTGWKVENDVGVWSVKDGAIVGTAGDEDVPKYQFLWSNITVKNFHLSLLVKQTPFEANGGIQFRSARIQNGIPHGYQADLGKGYWGTLFHEHGRLILARNPDTDEKNINHEGWNRYEILAVGERVWMAVNGKITVALRDSFGESEGLIAVQVHGGIPQMTAYKDFKLTHNPKVELVGMDEVALNKLLVDAPEMGASPNPNARKKK